MITYFQAIIIGLLQGVTELFPISSLGHSVLLPSLFGWNNLVAAQAQTESFFLAFLVGLHVATALALLVYYRQTWARIIKGFFSSVRHREVRSSDQRLAWLLILATIPVGVIGLLFEHSLRTLFAKPVAAAIFLVINGLLLFLGQRSLNHQHQRRESFDQATTAGNLSEIGVRKAVTIGSLQILALFAGISRSGMTILGGLREGLDHEDAARFSFLLATPIILAAGVYKLPDLLGPNGDGIRGQVIAGSLVAAAAAYAAVRFLDKYFRSRTLSPFGIYCIVFGLLMLLKIR